MYRVGDKLHLVKNPCQAKYLLFFPLSIAIFVSNMSFMLLIWRDVETFTSHLGYIITECCEVLRKELSDISYLTDCIASALIVPCDLLQVSAAQREMKIRTGIPMTKKGTMMEILMTIKAIPTVQCHLWWRVNRRLWRCIQAIGLFYPVQQWIIVWYYPKM